MEEEIRIRLAETRADFEAAVFLQRAVWGLSDLEIASAIQLIATTHAGGTLHLAETAGGTPLGFAYAFPALGRGTPHLHSDLLAVLPEHRRRGLGARLKWAQREEAQRRGLGLITWTFDPLQARNAHLNLRRLGAVAMAFVEDFYGSTSAALHHGLPTDRLLVDWKLDDPRVVRLATEAAPSPTVPLPPHPRINEVKWQAGWPVSSEPRIDLEAPALLLEIPPDWDVLCGAAPRVADDWHGKVRRALRAYFDRGYRASDFAPTEEAGRRRPLYVLTRS